MTRESAWCRILLFFSPPFFKGSFYNNPTRKSPRQRKTPSQVYKNHEGKRRKFFSPQYPEDKMKWLTFSAFPQHLRKLSNFNSYLAILSALDSAPIRRLEWQKQTSEVSHHHPSSSTSESVCSFVFGNAHDVIMCVLGSGGVLHVNR